MLRSRRRHRAAVGVAVLFLVGLLGLLGRSGHGAAKAEAYSEDAVKAAFLYRFTGYVQWPPPAHPGAPFTIVVLDADGIAAELGQLLQTHQIQDRSAQVRSIRSIREFQDAQVLYVGAAHLENLRHVIAAMAGRPVLIVTSEDGALDAGSMVNFVLLDQRVRFEIGLDAAHGAGLKVASELLAVAIRVRGRRAFSETGCDDTALTAYMAPCIREAQRQ